MDSCRCWCRDGFLNGAQRRADVPSRALARTESDSIRTPDFSFGETMSIIACMIEGTPAITMTLPILKPGARIVALEISSARRERAIRSRASFRSAPNRS
jgi:hypothetical protein